MRTPTLNPSMADSRNGAGITAETFISMIEGSPEVEMDMPVCVALNVEAVSDQITLSGGGISHPHLFHIPFPVLPIPREREVTPPTTVSVEAEFAAVLDASLKTAFISMDSYTTVGALLQKCYDSLSSHGRDVGLCFSFVVEDRTKSSSTQLRANRYHAVGYSVSEVGRHNKPMAVTNNTSGVMSDSVFMDSAPVRCLVLVCLSTQVSDSAVVAVLEQAYKASQDLYFATPADPKPEITLPEFIPARLPPGVV